MKLAEALLLRSDLQKKLASLRERIEHNVLVQDGDTPAEAPAELLRQAADAVGQLEKLLFTVNRANLAHAMRDGTPLTQALAKRDALVQRHAVIQGAATAATRHPERYGLREIKWLPTVNVTDLQRQADDLSRQIRELNAAIQEANWTVQLEE